MLYIGHPFIGFPLLHGALASLMKTSVERYSTDGTV